MSDSQDEGAIILHRGEGAKHLSPVGDTLIWKAGEEATDGAYSLHERDAPPGARSQPHIHHELVEAFYVLDGEFAFTIGSREVAGTPGTFVLVPRGVAHGWTVVGDSPARALVMFTPSARRAFFEELADLARDGGPAGPDRQRFGDLTRKFGWD